MKKIGMLGLALFLMGTMVVSAFAAEGGAGQQSGLYNLLAPTKASLIKLGGYLPNLGVLLLILVVGSLAAVGVAALISSLLELVQLEKGAKRIRIPDILKKGGIKLSLSELISEIIFFLIIIVTLVTALEFYGLATGAYISGVLSYIPHVIAAVFVLILGILLAIFISGIITLVGGNMRIAQSETLGNIAKYAIVIVAGLLALKELGLGVILTDSSKDMVFGGLVLGFALAFGFGAKDKAGKFLDNVFKK